MKLKYILALADCIRFAAHAGNAFSAEQIEHLAQFCARSNKDFDKPRWLAYIRDGPPKQ
jgi:hypothetical protein